MNLILIERLLDQAQDVQETEEIHKAVSLLHYVQNFIENRQITCAEAIHQRDALIEDASYFMERCCDIVGYFEHEHLKESDD